jgi:hypothetical protein
VTVRIADLVKRKGPLSPRQVSLLKKWLEEDWEAADVDREIVALISRLVATVDRTSATPRRTGERR